MPTSSLPAPVSPLEPSFPAPAIGAALRFCAELSASDVHAGGGQVPWIRRGGEFLQHPKVTPPTPASEIEAYAEMLGGDHASQMTFAEGTRWRASVFSTLTGTRLAFRRVPSEPPLLDMLGLPEECRRMCSLTDGLIIASGSTGSGKSTTLAAMLNLINETRRCHIMTLEDPVEYLHQPRVALLSQQNVRSDQMAQMMLTAMRSDPDVVMVGECRTRAQFETAMELAGTGHLVLTTLHARDAVSSCERITAACGEHGALMLSQTLRAVIAQKLIPDARDITSRHCVVELLAVNPGYRNLIKPSGNINGIRPLLANEQRSFDIVLENMVRHGKITMASAVNAADDEATLRERVSGWQR